MTNNRKIIIAIDGHSSCGKSTFAKAIAARLGYIFIDTGAMYRAVTLYALEHGAMPAGIVDEELVEEMLCDINIDFRFNPSRGASDIYVNGDLVESKIRTIEVSNCVSAVSSIAQVREKLVKMQQTMGERKGVVMDGRDIGTVVLPRATVKIFLTASAEVRAKRRTEELTAKGQKADYATVLKEIQQRDYQDMNRPIAPLKQAKDAILLDTSDLTTEQVIAAAKKIVEEKLA